MEAVNPDLVRSIGDLPVITICLLVIFGQFILVQQQMRELRRDVLRVALVLEKVLLRFEDWLEKHGG